MSTLASLIKEFNRLVQAGKTFEAMEHFYADDVTIQENEDEPRQSKAACMTHERQMYNGILLMKATLHKQAINEASGVVFSKWTFDWTTQTGQQFRLSEVSVQEWQNERIQAKKFYYQKAHSQS